MRTGTSKLRVRYAETDQMGVVYHANYLVWLEVGRTDLLRDIGWTYSALEASGIFLPVIEAHCEYRRPARYDDEIEVRTEGRLLSAVRLEFTYDVVLARDGTTSVVGYTRHAALTRDRRPCRLPEGIREAFA
jgi:acyl-CoA thioester hydrolase